MQFNHLIIEFNTPHIATLYLNRPEIHNAFDDLMITELRNALHYIKTLPQIRVLILAGKGKSFSAGANLSWMQRMAHYSLEKNLQDAKALALLMKELYEFPIPTIAKVHGAVMGGGVGLACACDIVFANLETVFCLSEVKIGLIPAVISPYVLNAMGERQARRYYLTAEQFDTKIAKSLGLVHEVFSEKKLEIEIIELAQKIARNSPHATAQAKDLIRRTARYPIDEEMLEDTIERIAKIRISEQGQEGLQAFLHKRRPSWALENET